MTRKNQNVEMFQGEGISIEVDCDGPDITGYGAEFRLYDFRGGPTLVTKADADSGVQITGPSTIEIELDPNDTNQLQLHFEENFYYTVAVIDDEGDPHTVTAGNITITE